MKNFRKQVGRHHPLRKAVSLVYRIKLLTTTDVLQQKAILQHTHTQFAWLLPTPKKHFVVEPEVGCYHYPNQQFYLAYDY